MRESSPQPDEPRVTPFHWDLTCMRTERARAARFGQGFAYSTPSAADLNDDAAEEMMRLLNRLSTEAPAVRASRRTRLSTAEGVALQGVRQIPLVDWRTASTGIADSSGTSVVM